MRLLGNGFQQVKFVFGCLLETRVLPEECSTVLFSCLPGWRILTNYDHHHLGRIWFCWSDGVEVTLLFSSAQIITCAVQIPQSGLCFMVSVVYAFNTEIDWRLMWDDIRATQAAYSHLSMPWILIGDYNEILASSEHSLAQYYRTSQLGMRQFQNLVSDCDLTDLSFVGSLFAWWNKRKCDPIGKKLDRALINGDWLTAFPQSFARFEAGGVSDHSRCLVQLSPVIDDTRKPFRFFHFLADHDSFLPTVSAHWAASGTLYHSRAALQLFHKKLKTL
uniref:Endonuclease/exonuclease/phosphatase domain-containing protein n=1 Tax=Noccaea caerulescens TaxID=107243 RepID=A0A1J3EH56_NOCCA